MKFIEFNSQEIKRKASICVEAVSAFEGDDTETRVFFGPSEPLVIPVSYDEFKSRMLKADRI